MRKGSLTWLALILAVTLAATGCWDTLAIDERGLYTGLAFDLKPDGNFKLTAQFPLTETYVHQQGGETQAMVLSTTGATPWEAHAALEARTSVRACLCQLKIVVLGESLVQNVGILEVLEFVERVPKYDRNLEVLVAEDAAAVLQAKPQGNPVSSLYLRSYFQEARLKQETSLAMPLWRLMVLLNEPGLEPVLPWVEVHDEELYVRGLAVFRGDRLAARLTPKEARGLLWARQGRGFRTPAGQVQMGNLSVPDPDQPGNKVDLGFLKSNSKAEVEVKDGLPAARLLVKVEGSVMSKGGEVRKLTPEIYAALEMAAAQAIQQEITDTLAICQEVNADVFGLGEEFRAKFPEVWSEEMWAEFFPTLPVTVEVEVSLKKSGLLY